MLQTKHTGSSLRAPRKIAPYKKTSTVSTARNKMFIVVFVWRRVCLTSNSKCCQHVEVPVVFYRPSVSRSAPEPPKVQRAELPATSGGKRRKTTPINVSTTGQSWMIYTTPITDFADFVIHQTLIFWSFFLATARLGPWWPGWMNARSCSVLIGSIPRHAGWWYHTPLCDRTLVFCLCVVLIWKSPFHLQSSA